MNSKKNHPDTWTPKDERELVFALGHRREAQSVATRLLQTSKMTLPESIARERKKIEEMRAYKKTKTSEKLCKGCGKPLKDHVKAGMRIILVQERN